MKISVIMPSYLGDYPNAATNRKEKFYRAMQSFADQTHEHKELLVVSDNCEDTYKLFGAYLSWHPHFNIYKPNGTTFRLNMMVERTENFSGHLRNAGIDMATGDIICYLDTDDFLLKDALAKLNASFPSNCDWVYNNDYVAENKEMSSYRTRDNVLMQGRIGTSGIAHKRSLDVEWPNGYGHDWEFIQRLMAKSGNYQKIPATGYVVCHIPGQIDF